MKVNRYIEFNSWTNINNMLCQDNKCNKIDLLICVFVNVDQNNDMLTEKHGGPYFNLQYYNVDRTNFLKDN